MSDLELMKMQLKIAMYAYIDVLERSEVDHVRVDGNKLFVNADVMVDVARKAALSMMQTHDDKSVHAAAAVVADCVLEFAQSAYVRYIDVGVESVVDNDPDDEV